MNLTEEQQTIQDHVKSNEGLTLVNSVAGSGKTTLLVSIAKEVGAKVGLYLAYSKAVATEAQKKFPEGVHCCTTHSLAWQAVVVPDKLRLGHFTYRDLPYDIDYEDRCRYVNLVKEFCLSAELSLAEFLSERNLPNLHIEMLVGMLNNMAQGKRECTHDFYLKLFHIKLATGQIKYEEEFDLTMLDEAGDLNAVTLEIFNLLPAKRSIMVGDEMQNIFTFNHTINCFDEMKAKGTHLNMTQSFRVNEHISSDIEGFCRKYLDPNMKFKGVPTDNVIKTRAFIARTNSALIDKMMDLNALGIPYGLTRTADQIFELPKLLCGLKYKGFVSNPEYKHLQDDVNEYFEDIELRKSSKTVLSHLKKKYSDDPSLSVALGTVLKHNKAGIMECYHEAKKHQKRSQPYMLGTGHSTKGLEYDEVTIAEDLNLATAKILSKVSMDGLSSLNDDEKSELKLYYVSASRAKKVLNNATQL